MKQRSQSFMPRFIGDESGQMLPLVGLLMIALLGMGALTIDLGSLFYTQRRLQASTDAAALAGAQGLPNTTTSTSNANLYSAASGNANAYSSMPGVVTTVTAKCLTTLTGQGIACVPPANANAIQVKQTLNAPTYFARLFGVSTVPLTASATASMRGSISSPYNVAIIIDTTASMASKDNDCGNITRLACALAGVQVLLNDLSP